MRSKTETVIDRTRPTNNLMYVICNLENNKYIKITRFKSKYKETSNLIEAAKFEDFNSAEGTLNFLGEKLLKGQPLTSYKVMRVTPTVDEAIQPTYTIYQIIRTWGGEKHQAIAKEVCLDDIGKIILTILKMNTNKGYNSRDFGWVEEGTPMIDLEEGTPYDSMLNYLKDKYRAEKGFLITQDIFNGHTPEEFGQLLQESKRDIGAGKWRDIVE